MSFFKSIFGNNKDIFKKMLISILRLNLKPNETKITLSNIKLPKDNEKEFQKINRKT